MYKVEDSISYKIGLPPHPPQIGNQEYWSTIYQQLPKVGFFQITALSKTEILAIA